MQSPTVKENSQSSVDPVWKKIEDQYELIEIAGEGSFGQVYKAKHRVTGKIFAIKYLSNVFKDEFTARKILREISIMR